MARLLIPIASPTFHASGDRGNPLRRATRNTTTTTAASADRRAATVYGPTPSSSTTRVATPAVPHPREAIRRASQTRRIGGTLGTRPDGAATGGGARSGTCGTTRRRSFAAAPRLPARERRDRPVDPRLGTTSQP